MTAQQEKYPTADIEDNYCERAWITNELLADTRRVWSKAYGRVISHDEAVEILNNVKRLAEFLVNRTSERMVA